MRNVFLLGALLLTACGGAHRADPPLLVPWNRIGDISLGEPKAQVVREYGTPRVLQRYTAGEQVAYRLHESRVVVEYDDGRVNAVDWVSPYYRAADGFGIGSTMPKRRHWRGFTYRARWKDSPCSCWLKFGPAAKPTAAIVFTRNGRASEIFFALRFHD